MSNLKAYLAANYMSGPKADAILARSNDPTLKKKRKKVKNEDYIGGVPSKDDKGALTFRDEDEEWRRRKDEDGEGEDAPVLGKDVATFRKSNSAWSTVASSSIPLPNAIAGPSSHTIKGEPLDPSDPAPPPVQLTKRKGGLRTAAQLQAEMDAHAETMSPEPEAPDPGKTVHRDASGRKLDVEKLKAEEKAKEEEEKRKEKEREEWSKGITQRREREDRVREEREMATKDVARYANDAAMNREMKEVERWNDPAASFLSSKKKAKGPRRPKYQGAWAPNRFGIPPGFRWDGVDRSNGFEKKFFQYQNAAARKEHQENQWSVEDM